MAGDVKRLKNGLDLVAYDLRRGDLGIFPANTILDEKKTYERFGMEDTRVVGSLALADTYLYFLRTATKGHADALSIVDKYYNFQNRDADAHGIEVAQYLHVINDLPSGLTGALSEELRQTDILLCNMLPTEGAFSLENLGSLPPVVIRFALAPPK